jgi:hypothetical protein
MSVDCPSISSQAFRNFASHGLGSHSALLGVFGSCQGLVFCSKSMTDDIYSLHMETFADKIGRLWIIIGKYKSELLYKHVKRDGVDISLSLLK